MTIAEKIHKELQLMLSCSCNGIHCVHVKNVKQLQEELEN